MSRWTKDVYYDGHVAQLSGRVTDLEVKLDQLIDALVEVGIINCSAKGEPSSDYRWEFYPEEIKRLGRRVEKLEGKDE